MKKVLVMFLGLSLGAMVYFPYTGQAQKSDLSNISATSNKTQPAFVPGEVLVQFKEGANNADVESALSKINGDALENVRAEELRSDGRGDLVLVRFQPDFSMAQATRALKNDPAVEFAEPNWIYTHQATSTDPYYTNGSLWGMYGDATSPANQFGSQAGEAWAAGNTGSASVYVGVIDEGIQFNHTDLNGQVWTNPYDPADGVDNDGNGYVDDIHGWDFDGNNNTIYDGGTRGSLDDHGTHVTGTIGAERNGAGVVCQLECNLYFRQVSRSARRHERQCYQSG